MYVVIVFECLDSGELLAGVVMTDLISRLFLALLVHKRLSDIPSLRRRAKLHTYS